MLIVKKYVCVANLISSILCDFAVILCVRGSTIMFLSYIIGVHLT